MELTDRERLTLRFVCDTIFPSIRGDPFLERKASDFGVDVALAETVEKLLLPSKARDFRRVLGIIENPALNLLLSLRPKRFSAMSQREREAFLASWRDSPLPVKRTAFQAMKRLTCFLAYSLTDDSGVNPNWADVGYPGPQTVQRTHHPERLTISPNVPSGEAVMCDVCVVGSGAGGSVVAFELARSGYDVVVLEEGSYETSDTFVQNELLMTRRLFQQHGTLSTSDLSFTLLAGRCAGGGTVVNWNTCLRPPKRVLEEWEKEHGIEGLTDRTFESYVDEVWATIHVNDMESQRNRNNQALWDGCVALGMEKGKDFDVISRNAVGCQERCDFCSYGCIHACKQSTIMNYLPMAHALGARFFFHTRAQSVVVEHGEARGVSAVYDGGGRSVGFEVRARAVVVACGGIETPALLLRSGIRERGIGEHLRLDPTAAVGGVFDGRVEAWKGPPQTVAVWKYIDLDGTFHGFWVECAPAHPGLFAFSVPWVDGVAHKEFVRRYCARSVDAIILLREWGEGSVTTDRHGSPVVKYTLDRRDRENMLRGMAETARILAAAGAVQVWSAHSTPVVYGDGHSRLRQGDVDRFDSEVRKRGIGPNRMMLYSAHLMGSCRMSSDPREGPTKPSGELHSVRNLFVGDACVFPTTPGVNPMVTIMAMARRTSEFIKGSLGQPSRQR
jgi:choline dehydrogenase-like flavoprotein